MSFDIPFEDGKGIELGRPYWEFLNWPVNLLVFNPFWKQLIMMDTAKIIFNCNCVQLSMEHNLSETLQFSQILFYETNRFCR